MHLHKSGKRGDRIAAVCSFCAQDVFYGERVWRCCGLMACEDCFDQFARLELKPFEEILGEENENDAV